MNKLKEQFGHYQFGPDEDLDKISDESLEALLCNAVHNKCKEKVDLKTVGDKTVGFVQWDKENDTMRVVVDPPQAYQKQVTRVDAFLYANQRIAGKTFMSPMVINGGTYCQRDRYLGTGHHQKLVHAQQQV